MHVRFSKCVSGLQTLQTQFDQLQQNLSGCNLEDFGLDQDTYWSMHSVQVSLAGLDDKALLVQNGAIDRKWSGQQCCLNAHMHHQYHGNWRTLQNNAEIQQTLTSDMSYECIVAPVTIHLCC